jgi:hypothetical protein
MAKPLSSFRRQLLDVAQAIEQLQEVFLEREPLLPGSVYTLRRRCGKPNCRCADGHLHESEVLSYRGGEQPRNVTPRPGQLTLFKQGAKAYRRFRQARAQLVKLQRQMLKLIDRIEAERIRQGKKKFDVSPKRASSRPSQR